MNLSRKYKSSNIVWLLHVRYFLLRRQVFYRHGQLSIKERTPEYWRCERLKLDGQIIIDLNDRSLLSRQISDLFFESSLMLEPYFQLEFYKISKAITQKTRGHDLMVFQLSDLSIENVLFFSHQYLVYFGWIVEIYHDEIFNDEISKSQQFIV